jgi:hypothetical protein
VTELELWVYVWLAATEELVEVMYTVIVEPLVHGGDIALFWLDVENDVDGDKGDTVAHGEFELKVDVNVVVGHREELGGGTLTELGRPSFPQAGLLLRADVDLDGKKPKGVLVVDAVVEGRV